jgi:hypothetical protein
MNILEPMSITDSTLTSSNIPENDYPVWNNAASYVAGDRVIVLSTHSVYEAVIANTNKNPVTDDGTHWIKIGATNRWRAFDRKISARATRNGNITYTFAPSEIVDGAALFGLVASSVQVIVKDSSNVTIFDETVQVVDRTEAVNWFAWLLDPIEFDTESMITGFPGYVGNSIEVKINNTGTAEVGQLVIGRITKLGTLISGTTIGYLDFSRKDRDDFGNPVIVERETADKTEFRFAFPPEDARRVKRVVQRLRAIPAVYFGEVNPRFGVTVFGFNQGIEVPLEVGMSFATMEVEGLT